MAVFRVSEGFAIPDPNGFMIAYQIGQLVSGDDAVAKTHRRFMETVEAATANPGQKRSLRVPSATADHGQTATA